MAERRSFREVVFGNSEQKEVQVLISLDKVLTQAIVILYKVINHQQVNLMYKA